MQVRAKNAAKLVLSHYCAHISFLLFGLALSHVASAVDDEVIRIATWNLNNLHYETGKPLRRGAPARQPEDYKRLQRYAERLNADIIALQEVNGPKAAARVFPRDQYKFFFSGRLADDNRRRAKSDRIYTGFAVRKNRFKRLRKTDYRELSIAGADGHRTRWGVDLEVTVGRQSLRLLNVHLKSRCFTDSLKRAKNTHCQTLARQIEPLELWIDKRAAEGTPFVVLGDFNRAFDVHVRRDHLWQAIDDGEPSSLVLRRYPYQRAATCWRKSSRYHREPIDFIIVDRLAATWVKPKSFMQLDYANRDRDERRGLPSDHCPIALAFSPPGG